MSDPMSDLFDRFPALAELAELSGKKKFIEHPALSRTMLGKYAEETASPRSYKCDYRRRKNETQLTIHFKETVSRALAIPAGVGEMFGYRLAGFAGVRVPRVTLTTDEPSEMDCKTNYVKPVTGGWMLSERVPVSLPIYYLPGQTTFGVEEWAFRKTFKNLFDKRCPLGREAYADFPSEPPQASLDVVKWDSEQRLRLYAYRSLLCCTYPHASNVLVDTSGRLHLIDHEKCCLPTEGDDIELLSGMIADSPQAITVCKQVAQGITPQAIEQSLDGIPDNFWRPETGRWALYDNPRDAAGYFGDRLNHWKGFFSEKREAANAV
ncbi:MAG: hypothetical protein AABN33_10960 [Acidobacteriota bacterium]